MTPTIESLQKELEYLKGIKHEFKMLQASALREHKELAELRAEHQRTWERYRNAKQLIGDLRAEKAELLELWKGVEDWVRIDTLPVFHPLFKIREFLERGHSKVISDRIQVLEEFVEAASEFLSDESSARLVPLNQKFEKLNALDRGEKMKLERIRGQILCFFGFHRMAPLWPAREKKPEINICTRLSCKHTTPYVR